MADEFDGLELSEDECAALIDDAIDEMNETYEVAYLKIYKALMDARKDPSYATYMSQQKLMVKVNAALSDFAKEAREIMERSMANIEDLAEEKAWDHLGLDPPDMDHERSMAGQYADDALGYLGNQIERMSSTVRHILREDAALVVMRSKTEHISRREALAMIRGQLAGKDPVFKFVDRAGRAWPLDRYVGMLVSTSMMEAYRQSYMGAMARAGQDLAMISTVGSEDDCRFWEGKVLSITGATPGYTTYSEAVGSGQVFHPRCRHTLIAFDPGQREP